MKPISWLNEPIKLNDGLATLSIQASRGHYCTPHDDDGPYEKVEITFQSITMKPDKVLDNYSAGPNGDIFAWVPVSILREVIRNYDGVAPESRKDFDAIRLVGPET